MDVYHYHVQDGPPFTIGCFGPNDDGSLVTVPQCREFYTGCGDGDAETLKTTDGEIEYDYWCPCYDANGSNSGKDIAELAVFKSETDNEKGDHHHHQQQPVQPPGTQMGMSFGDRLAFFDCSPSKMLLATQNPNNLRINVALSMRTVGLGSQIDYDFVRHTIPAMFEGRRFVPQTLGPYDCMALRNGSAGGILSWAARPRLETLTAAHTQLKHNPDSPPESYVHRMESWLDRREVDLECRATACKPWVGKYGSDEGRAFRYKGAVCGGKHISYQEFAAEAYRLWWVPSNEAQHAVDTIVRSYALPKGYVGAHFRGGDKLMELIKRACKGMAYPEAKDYGEKFAREVLARLTQLADSSQTQLFVAVDSCHDPGFAAAVHSLRRSDVRVRCRCSELCYSHSGWPAGPANVTHEPQSELDAGFHRLLGGKKNPKNYFDAQATTDPTECDAVGLIADIQMLVNASSFTGNTHSNIYSAVEKQRKYEKREPPIAIPRCALFG